MVSKDDLLDLFGRMASERWACHFLPDDEKRQLNSDYANLVFNGPVYDGKGNVTDGEEISTPFPYAPFIVLEVVSFI